MPLPAYDGRIQCAQEQSSQPQIEDPIAATKSLRERTNLASIPRMLLPLIMTSRSPQSTILLTSAGPPGANESTCPSPALCQKLRWQIHLGTIVTKGITPPVLDGRQTPPAERRCPRRPVLEPAASGICRPHRSQVTTATEFRRKQLIRVGCALRPAGTWLPFLQLILPSKASGRSEICPSRPLGPSCPSYRGLGYRIRAPSTAKSEHSVKTSV
jgi:hypothetical protein